MVFRGKTIPGVLAVVGESYTKNGKWSHTTYQLMLGNGVEAIPGKDGWESGTFCEGLAAATRLPTSRWHEVAEALKVSLEEAKRFLQEWKPKAAARLDQVEADIAALDHA